MKKLLFLFITLSAILITACSDDDQGPRPKEISKVYREPDLKMTLNGKDVKGKAVMFLTSDLASADIMLINTIPGEDSLLIAKTTMTNTGKDNIYTFKDSIKNDDRKVEIEGQISKDQGITIDVKHTVTAYAAKKWKLAFYPLEVKIVADPLDSVDVKGLFGNNVIPIVKGPGTSARQDFVGTVKSLGMFLGMAILLEMELKADNNIIIGWSPKLSSVPLPPGQTPEGMAKYNINNGMIYPSIAVDDLLASASISELASSMGLTLDEILVLLNLAQQAYKGLPMNLTYTGTAPNYNGMQLMVNKEMMQPYMAVIIKLLAPLLADLDMGGINIGGITPEGLQAFMVAFDQAFEKSESFELRIALTKNW